MLREEKATALANWIFQDIICRWGALREIVTDNAAVFIKALDYLAKKYKIHYIRISGYNSRANGLVERPHCDVRQALVKAADGIESKWSQVAHSVFWAERVTARKRMGCSPYFAATGTHPLIPLDIMYIASDMTIVGTKRMIVYDDVEPLEKIKIYDARVETPPHYDTFAEFHYSYHYGDRYIPYIKQEEPLKVECQHFLDCIREGKTPLTGGRQGLQVVKVLEAASASIKQNGLSVPLGANSNGSANRGSLTNAFARNILK